MGIVIKNNFITEDIIDENGNKLGELKFNPSDSRIMGKLSSAIRKSTLALNKLKDKKIPNLSNSEFTSIEDFEKHEEDIKIVCDAMELEEQTYKEIFNDLSEVFGKETIEIFTGGTLDIETLKPLLEFVMPYVTEDRTKKVNKYISKNKEEIEVL